MPQQQQQQQQLHFFDLHRWLIGDNPGWFLLEVIIRAILIYAMLMVILRAMGKRAAGQMSISELAVIVTLGAAVGVPMQVPDKGMLNALLILLVALVFQRGLSWMAFRSRKVELVSQGDVTTLVEDGRLLLDKMESNVVSRERIFAVLRGDGIEHLGEIRRVYMETTGRLSVYRNSDVLPGLSVLPTSDTKLRSLQLAAPGKFACFSCGHVCDAEKTPECRCPECGSTTWTEAVRRIERVEEEWRRKNDDD